MKTMLTVPRTFGRRLTAALLLRGLTQADFAVKCEVSSVTMRRICSQGHQPSSTLARVMEQQIGSAAWAYCMGLSDVLTEGK